MVLRFPNISPEIFSISFLGIEFALRWYAMAYIVGILIGWRIAVVAARRVALWHGAKSPATTQQIDDLLTWVIIGVIAGGRLGYVLFYQPAYYLANPIEIPMVWQGGMSFHGGFLGVVIAGVWYCRRQGMPIVQISDMMAISVAPALALGRISNFINAELWGRPTDLPWGVIFPGQLAQTCANVAGLCARHPSQLYEAALEGFLLGSVLLYLAFRRGGLQVPGRMTGIFLMGYGLSRFVVEYFRQADAQFITPDNPVGFVLQLAGSGVTMGQLLSLPMVVAGLVILTLSRRRHG